MGAARLRVTTPNCDLTLVVEEGRGADVPCVVRRGRLP